MFHEENYIIWTDLEQAIKGKKPLRKPFCAVQSYELLTARVQCAWQINDTSCLLKVIPKIIKSYYIYIYSEI